jgi:CubicO group peptidase (beta-lactamase class C family)
VWAFVLSLASPSLPGWTGPWPDPWRTADLDPSVLAPFFDGLLGAQLAAYQVPGAAVAVVQGDRVVLARGYGLADVATGRPVTAERTLFRAGSVAKVLTWMALLALAESGAIALDEDVSPHLGDLALPETFQEPVTAAHLMTHTAGLEDRFGGLFAASADRLLALPDYLRRYRPERVRPPGRLAAYSNYGAALAGHLVERVTGVAFQEFVEGRLLRPLGMTRSTFAQPLPPGLAEDLATGYGKRLEPLGFEWIQTGPAGALSTTAADMATLMRTILAGGRLGEARVLGKRSVDLLLDRQFAHDPRLAGLTFGLEEFYVNGERLLWHPGDTLGFSSALILLPARGLGLFVAYNRLADSQPRADLLKTFMDRFYPAPTAPPVRPGAGAAERGRRYAGSYLPTRSNLTGPEKVFKLFRPVTVAVLPDGQLGIQGLWVVKEGPWVEVEDGVYRHAGSEERVLFREQDGETVLLEGNYPQGAYLRLPWYGAYGLHYGLWAGAGPVFLAALGAGAIGASCRRRAGVSAATPRGPRGLVQAMSLFQLLFLGALLAVLVNLRALAPRIDALLEALRWTAPVGALLAAAASAALVGVWRRRAWTAGARLFYSGVAVTGLAFSASLAYWGLWPG